MFSIRAVCHSPIPQSAHSLSLSLSLHVVLMLQIKFPRVLSLLSESRPEESELKSEAQFQRLLASYTGNPLTPKTPRAPSDRGRYPEEAGDEEDTAVQSED